MVFWWGSFCFSKMKRWRVQTLLPLLLCVTILPSKFKYILLISILLSWWSTFFAVLTENIRIKLCLQVVFHFMNTFICLDYCLYHPFLLKFPFQFQKRCYPQSVNLEPVVEGFAVIIIPQTFFVSEALLRQPVRVNIWLNPQGLTQGTSPT